MATAGSNSAVWRNPIPVRLSQLAVVLLGLIIALTAFAFPDVVGKAITIAAGLGFTSLSLPYLLVQLRYDGSSRIWARLGLRMSQIDVADYAELRPASAGILGTFTKPVLIKIDGTKAPFRFLIFWRRRDYLRFEAEVQKSLGLQVFPPNG
jgi:hypothetical protein